MAGYPGDQHTPTLPHRPQTTDHSNRTVLALLLLPTDYEYDHKVCNSLSLAAAWDHCGKIIHASLFIDPWGFSPVEDGMKWNFMSAPKWKEIGIN